MMKYIGNYRDYKQAFELVNLYEEIIAQHGFGDTGKAKEHVIETKRAIRKYRDKIAEDAEMEHLVKSYDIDGYILLQRMPNAFDDMDDAEEYFDEYMRIRPTYSAYDCTGRPFTEWHKIVKRNDEWWCYHSIGFDV